MPEYEEVSFSSRQAGITLSGWYIPSADPGAPAVVVTHGIGASKIASNALTVAGMLHKNGFNVLIYDIRNHGQSSKDNGRTSIGNKEYQDVLGAWDYLVNERGFDPTQVGLFGLSLGGASALNAFAEEPRVAAILVDSPFSDLRKIIAEELVRTGYPAILGPAGVLAARLFDGVDLLAHTPQDAIRKDAGRPIFIIHGTQDARINFHHSQALEALAKETGANVTVWYVEGADHVLSVFLQPEAYEQKMAAFYKKALHGK
jgi:dipeptidyl aminopeptidase/acylaminoacyl peptidase